MNRIRAARQALGWTQNDLADRSGVSARTIHAIEKGRPCRQATKRKILRTLGVPWDLRSEYFPVSLGFPFDLTFAFPPNLPLPTKIVTEVLDPIDIRAEFGDDPDIAEVDAEIRSRMQDALDRLSRARRFPIIG